MSIRIHTKLIFCMALLQLAGCAGRSLVPTQHHGQENEETRVSQLAKLATHANGEEAPVLNYPENWVRLETIHSNTDIGILSDFEDTELQALIAQSLAQSFTLKAQAARVKELREAVRISRANRLPALDASIDAARRRSASFGNALGDGTSTDSSFGAGADVTLELDIWGRLNDAQRQALLNYQAERYAYDLAAQSLTASVARAWYGALFARELSEVLSQRVISVRRNLEIVEQSYRQGITTALDVYLARSSLAQEEARLAEQQQTQLEQVAALQSLITDYPNGDASILQRSNMPERLQELEVGRPAELISRRPDLNRAWTQLLAQNAGLAVAHKQRWPRLVLNASLDDGAGSFTDIFDGNDWLWSVASRLTQPVFQGGRLKAQESQAEQRVVQAEQEYFRLIQSAFADVENALSNRRALDLRRSAIVRSDASASAAYDLSFQQYQRGLVDYATVLQAEQRAFDARTNLLNLRFQLLINRIDLYTALGGSGANQLNLTAESS